MRKRRRDGLYREIGERIRHARAARGLSQADLAWRLERSRASLVNLEKGRHRPTLDLLFDAAEVLGIPVLDLIPAEAAAAKALDIREAVPPEYRGFVIDILTPPSTQEGRADEVEHGHPRARQKAPSRGRDRRPGRSS